MIRSVLWMPALLLLLAGCESRDNPAYSGHEVVNTERALYPEGPYGWKEGDVLPNWVFLEQDGRPMTMQDLRAGTFADTLVLLPSADWMDAASGMAIRAGRVHALDRDDILVVSAVFEDAGGEPAEPADAAAWQASYEIPWPVIAEPEGQFRLAWRNDMRAAVLVNLDTMTRLSPEARPAIGEILWP